MRKFIFAILAFVICSSSIITYVNAENEEEQNEQTETKNLQTQREELQTQLNDTTGRLDEVQTELSENLQQVDKLDGTIANSQQQLDELNNKIIELQKNMENVEAELKIAEENYDKQKELLDNRLIAAYESSEIQYLDVILTSKSISEFLSNYFLVKELATYESELLEEMKQKRDKIELSKKTLENTEKQLADMKANQTRTAKILENTKTVRENFISKLSDEEKELQTQIDEFNSRFAEINSQILKEALEGIDTEYIGGELAWPTPGYTRITSNYGTRYHPVLHYTALHTGVDIGAPLGANFIAANDGIVTKAEFNKGYGNMVIIDHGGGVSTLYAHGSEMLVTVGQTVKKGDTVLKVGSTGYSTGPHAHFEVRLNGVVTNPLPYITNGLIPE